MVCCLEYTELYVQQDSYLYTSCHYVCGHYLSLASVFAKLIRGCPVFTVEHLASAQVFKYLR